ncbi:MAG: hypothetical protein JWO12_783 [Frankiales bacterium]|nr:hypothetical protein [Frankiales bacterium]
MSDDPVTALLALAATQRGAFTWKQAQSLGWTEAAATVARRGDWTRLGRGVYVHAFIWEALPERDRHLCAAMGRVLAGRGWHVRAALQRSLMDCRFSVRRRTFPSSCVTGRA